MTGAYLRVKRDGKWDNVEVEHLTDDERKQLLKDDPRSLKWINLLCKKLVEVEWILDDLAKDGIIRKEE